MQLQEVKYHVLAYIQEHELQWAPTFKSASVHTRKGRTSNNKLNQQQTERRKTYGYSNIKLQSEKQECTKDS